MRRIVTSISAAALALSFVAQSAPAAGVEGFDSSYAGESAFLTLTRGTTGTFTVFFANAGTTSWARGTFSQVDLAACLDDKVTCDAQDASEAPYNSGWKSATRYTTATQDTVAPGQIGTFTYSVAVPASGTGLHRFNGAVVVSATGANIHNEGYYQDVQVNVPVAQGITIAPNFLATLVASAGAGLANENRGVRQYTATLGGDIPPPVRIAIWSANCVGAPEAGGKFAFNDANGDRKADDTDCNTKTGVFIQEVNGLSLGGQQINVEASPPTGTNTITFSLNYREKSNAQVKPIVFKDLNGDTLIDVDTPPCCGAPDTNTQARAVTGVGRNTEPVGVGGETDWTQPEAVLGTYPCGRQSSAALSAADTNEGRVRFVDATTGYAVVSYTSGSALTEFRFNFKTGDRFSYVNTTQDTNTSFGAEGPGLSLAQFKQFLSSRDRLTINYNPDPTAPSSWIYCADRPDRPSSVIASVTVGPQGTGGIPAQQAPNCVSNCETGTADTATAQTTAARGSATDPTSDPDDVVLTFPISPNPCVKSYFVFRQLSSDSGINWQQTKVVSANARVTTSSDTNVTVYDLEVPAGFHRWGVVAKVDDVDNNGGSPAGTTVGTIIDCGNGAIDATATNDATGSTRAGSAPRYANTLTTRAPSGSATGAPQSTDMFISKSGGLNAQLDTGDVFKIVFNQVMIADSTGKVMQLTDPDGTTMTLRCNGNSTPPAGEYGAVCNFNTGAETVKGTSYPANRVATVYIQGMALPTSSAAAGTTPGMQFPSTVVDQGGWTNTGGLNWDLASSPDKAVETP